MAFGIKTGGRVKGVKNKDKQSVMEILDRLRCCPVEGMAQIALNNLPCGVCRGTGWTKYKMPSGAIGDRTCESCYGTLFEACSPELRGKMYAEIAQYVLAKRKAVELSTPDGPLQVDLSKLSDEQLKQLDDLHKAASPKRAQ